MHRTPFESSPYHHPGQLAPWRQTSSAQAVAVNASGQILISGLVTGGSPFPVTPGAYNIANSLGHPYLLELDPTGARCIFSATVIGGSAIALDPSGNIYVAGTTFLLDYPTTPGAYRGASRLISMKFPRGGQSRPTSKSQVQRAGLDSQARGLVSSAVCHSTSDNEVFGAVLARHRFWYHNQGQC
jgi:hypothetical protein